MILSRADGRLHYEVYGDGDLIVFLNGFASGISTWYPVIKDIKKDRQCLLYDYIGTGESTSFDRYEFSLESYCADLCALIDALGAERADVVGYSMGGWIGQYLLAAHPDRVRSLALINSSSRIFARQNWAIRHFIEVLRDCDIEVFSKLMFVSYYSPEYFEKNVENLDRIKNLAVAAFRQQAKRNWERLLASFLSFDVESALRRCDVPVLLISGEHDFLCPRMTALRLQSLLPASRWHEFKAVGHAIPMERYAELAATMADFLRDCTGSAPRLPVDAA